ncbi:MAG: Carbamate kinase 2 [Deltaproteobacteria bacterium]|jgi:carbamate kinase|nr:Carbamate kinase 2 [Deltaproteobacteria bacterium]
MMEKHKLIIFALGGNEISPVEVDPKTGKLIPQDLPTQWKRTAETCEIIADFIKENQDYYYVVTHGNGPQIGNILLRSEYSSKYLHKIPLDVCGADSQGALGYMLAQLSNSLQVRGLEIHTAEIITQVIVDSDDPAFVNPSKFIGPPLTKKEASGLMKKNPDYCAKFYKNADSSESSVPESFSAAEEKIRNQQEIWRRVVPSPVPKGIVEIDMIEACYLSGNIPIAVGGGGIPVVNVIPNQNDDGETYECNYGISYNRRVPENKKPAAIFKGVEGVIDKDLASSLLARMIMERAQTREHELEVELVILTNIDGVKINYQQPNEKSLSELSLKETTELYESGVFPEGSMGPKIKAMIDFLNCGGKRSYITKVDMLQQTISGDAGTRFIN